MRPDDGHTLRDALLPAFGTAASAAILPVETASLAGDTPDLTAEQAAWLRQVGTGPIRPAAWNTVVAAFQAQVERSPAALALACGNERLSYAELNAEANRIGHHLRRQGIGRGDRVAVLLPRGPQVVAAILGVQKAGAAYLPLDPAYPPQRLGFIVGDAGARLSLTTPDLRGLAPGAVALDAAALAAEPADDLPVMAGPDDPAYVIYTSGSTGLPKGVAVRHQGFANLVQWYAAALGLDATDRTLLVSALGFDLTQKNLFAPLVTGGTLHCPQGGIFDPAAAAALIDAQSITCVNATPSTFYPILEGPWADRPGSLRSLRRVTLGGEPIRPERLRPWLRRMPAAVQVLNTYGPTECTDICAAHAVSATITEDTVPLGRPVDNARLVVLDPEGRLTPPGLPGELWIGGVGVGIGYLGRPELNADRFRMAAMPGCAPERMYRTGDRVRWRTDGRLQFLGRLDHQVKLHGQRIELGEVEAVLATHPGVGDAIVGLVPDAPGGEPRLVAWIVPRPGAETPAPEAMRRHLALRLPAAMLPSAYVPLSVLPLTPNGKADRDRLPPPPRQAPASPMAPPHGGTDPRRGDMEQVLARIFSDVLGHAAIDPRGNFFDLGGTSLQLLAVQAAIARQTGVAVPATAIFAHPTVAALAGHLRGEASPASSGSVAARAARQASALRRRPPGASETRR